jgi:hypoxanthine phosphoribosyltransferase
MVEIFNAQTIDIKTKILAKQISDEHRGDATPVVMVGVLNGAFMFYSDLVRNMDVDVECDFIRVKSYSGKERGSIQLTKDVETSVQGKHVYLIDDIYDSGVTMNALANHFYQFDPAGVQMVTLIKRYINEVDMPMGSLYGFVVEEEWVVGFGMDDDLGKKRSLPYILAI